MFPALLAALLACGVVVTTPGTSVAAAGDFDPSFGTAGVATAPPSGTLPFTGANALAIDGSGRIVTVGSAHDGVANQDDFTIHRFLPSGAIDSGFGTNGISIVPMTTGWSINQVTGVGIQPDGRIVLGARVYLTADPERVGFYGVVRLTSHGDLDTDFDGGVAANGILTVNVGPILPPAGSEVERKLSVDETGRILMSGVTYYAGPPTATMHATMARLNPDGTFDSTFSGDGKFDLQLPTIDSDLQAFADLPGANGYVLGGRTIPNVAPTIGQPTIVRISETGDLVPGFTSSLSNTAGRSTTYWQGDPMRLGEIYALAGLPSGSLVAGGYQNVGATTMAALAKYTPTGGLDPSFGTGGVTLFQAGGGPSLLDDLVVQPDGKIVAAVSGTDANHGFVVRFTASGSLDPTFGSGGTVATGDSGGASALALQADGKVVDIARRGLPDTTLVRLLADPPPVVAPSIQVTSPTGKTIKAKKLKAFAGTAGPAASVSLVQIAVQRVDKRLLKDDKRCLWLANHRGSFKKVKAKHKKCSQPLYRKAAGTTAWSYALRKSLATGKYVVYARVELGDGREATARKPFRIK